MKLSEDAKATARHLVDQLNSGNILRELRFTDVTSARDKTTQIIPVLGVNDSSVLSIPPLADIRELGEAKLIRIADLQSPKGRRSWEVTLLQDLQDAVDRNFEENENISSNTMLLSRLPKFFISYSHDDIEFKGRIERKLRRAYDDIWSDDKLSGGEVWWKKILDEIALSDVFIYLLSDDSVKSTFCRAEFAEAIRLQKRIIPVQIRPRTNLPNYIRNQFQIVDLSSGINEETITELFAATIKLSIEISPSQNPLWSRPIALPNREIHLSIPAEIDPIAREDELNTGIFLLPGDNLFITANGEITVDSGKSWMNPSGAFLQPATGQRVFYPNPDALKAHSQIPEIGETGIVGSLIGWIGNGKHRIGRGFLVGEHCSVTVSPDQEGFLYLAVNDSKGTYGDNSGEFEVIISLKP
ncbi:MAG: TIR domain-containing protein [Anaerolineaceae bacterium]|nr:TIR domain-containing protein [Anaerolineaceae bacterium]